MDAAYGENDARGRGQYEKHLHVLRHDHGGVQRVIRALRYLRCKHPRRERIKEVLGYLRRNRHRMDYAVTAILARRFCGSRLVSTLRTQIRRVDLPAAVRRLMAEKTSRSRVAPPTTGSASRRLYAVCMQRPATADPTETPPPARARRELGPPAFPRTAARVAARCTWTTTMTATRTSSSSTTKAVRPCCATTPFTPSAGGWLRVFLDTTGDPDSAHFGLGAGHAAGAPVDELRLEWPDGLVSRASRPCRPAPPTRYSAPLRRSG